MDVESRLELIKQVGEEVVTEEELRQLLETKSRPIAYDGFEPSGTNIHIAQGLLRAINTNKMTQAGVHFKFLVADWHAWANNKMGGDLEKIQTVGKYFVEVWRAAGMDLDKVEFVWASEHAKDDHYWKKVMQVARNSTVSRIIRCGQIMGRKENDVMQASQILYPCMQCADIFHLKADITQLGVDQRKVNVLAREIGPKIGFWKPVIVSHHMLMGLTPPKQTIENYSETSELIRNFPLRTKSLSSRFNNLVVNNFADDTNIVMSNSEWLKAYSYDVKKRIYEESERIKERFEVNPSELNSILKKEIPIIMSEIEKLDIILNKRLILNQNFPKLQMNERTDIGKRIQKIGDMITVELNNKIDEELRSKSFEKKMSKSIPDSAIFMMDSAEEVRRKIEKAYCPAKSVHDNPLAEYTRYIIFEKFSSVDIERPVKFGGDFEVESYKEFVKLYSEGKIHPADLKSTVTRYLNELLEPIREKLKKNKTAQRLEEEIKSFKITR